MSMVVGLTGQTGAGKSTVSAYARQKGIGVIEADAVAREALAPGSECLLKLAAVFGNDIIGEDGSCNRAVLAAKAFSDKKNTRLLNQITHPWIIERTKEYISEMTNNHYDMILFDASQLFESGGDKLCDHIAAVVADEQIRLDRIMNRDKISREAALRRMRVQLEEGFFRERAEFIIDGSLSLEEVKKQADSIFERLMRKETDL